MQPQYCKNCVHTMQRMQLPLGVAIVMSFSVAAASVASSAQYWLQFQRVLLYSCATRISEARLPATYSSSASATSEAKQTAL
jgi:hypothetical protein